MGNSRTQAGVGPGAQRATDRGGPEKEIWKERSISKKRKVKTAKTAKNEKIGRKGRENQNRLKT